MIKLDGASSKPLYLQLRDALRSLILSGEFPPGKLPSAREMAGLLHVSRNTVDEAYNYLVEDGLLMVKRGLGTFVCPNASVKPVNTDSNIDWDAVVSSSTREYTHYMEQGGKLSHGDKSIISFTSLAPDHHVFLVEQFRKALNDVLVNEGSVLLNYGYTRGYEPLRDYLKGYLTSKGISFLGQDMLIVNGFRQGIELVSKVLVNKGDSVIVEAPTYNGVLGVMRSKGASVTAIELDECGMRADLLEQAINKKKPSMVYCVPTYQNPTGLNMSFERRRQIVDICARYGVPLVEDGFNEELRYRGESYPALKAIDRSGGVIYIGSFSKVLFPGLRVGWVVAPEKLHKYLINEKYNQDIHTGVLQQAGLYEFCIRGNLERHLRASRSIYCQRMDALISALNEKFVDIATWPTSDGGFSVFVTLKKNINTRELLTKAREKGVLFVPGDVFYPDGRGKNSMRLGFSRLTPEQIHEGIQRLREVFKEVL